MRSLNGITRRPVSISRLASVVLSRIIPRPFDARLDRHDRAIEMEPAISFGRNDAVELEPVIPSHHAALKFDQGRLGNVFGAGYRGRPLKQLRAAERRDSFRQKRLELHALPDRAPVSNVDVDLISDEIGRLWRSAHSQVNVRMCETKSCSRGMSQRLPRDGTE